MKLLNTFGTYFQLLQSASLWYCLANAIDFREKNFSVDLVFTGGDSLYDMPVKKTLEEIFEFFLNRDVSINFYYGWSNIDYVHKRYALWIFPEYAAAKLVISHRKNIPPIIIYDDGLGSYVPWYKRFLWLMNYPNYRKNWLSIFGKYIWRSTSLLVLNRHIWRYRLFYYDGKSILPNNEVISCYVNFMSEYCRYLEGSDIFNVNGKVAFFVGQSLIEEKIAEPLAYNRIVEIILAKLIRQYEYVYIKPHPREDEKKYIRYSELPNVIILPKDQKADCLLSIGKIDLVIGFSSTLLLIAKHVYGLKTISVYNKGLCGDRCQAVYGLISKADIPIATID